MFFKAEVSKETETENRREMAKIGALLKSPDIESRLKLLAYLVDADILDEGFSKEEREALMSTVFHYYQYQDSASVQMLKVIRLDSVPLIPTKKIAQLLINKLEHFIFYCQHALPTSMDFADYFDKSGLNRAISAAWIDKKKMPKGFFETLFSTGYKDPEEFSKDQHITLCLSLEPRDNFRFCLKVLLHFLSQDLKADSYAFCLINRLAMEFDHEANNNELKKRLAEWHSEKLAPNDVRDLFCRAVKDRYFTCTLTESTTKLAI